MHRFYDFIFQNLACINFLVSIQRFNLTAYIITFKRTTLNCLYFSVVIWQAASIGMHEVVAHSLKLYSISKRVCTIMKYTEKLTFYGEKNFTDFSFYIFLKDSSSLCSLVGHKLPICLPLFVSWMLVEEMFVQFVFSGFSHGTCID